MITQQELDEYTVLSVASKSLGYKSRTSLEQYIAQDKLKYLTLNNGTRIFHWDDILKIKE